MPYGGPLREVPDGTRFRSMPAPVGTNQNDTIVAISTPPGRGGIGIVRLSGPAALAIAAPMLRLTGSLEHARARFAEILDPASPVPDARLDEAVVTFFAGPNSYTGEDIVEIAAHGSPVVLDLLLRSAIQSGARLANPGEFTERAFLSGRIDLTQAEAVRDLIEAQTIYQARLAAEQMGGSLSRRIQPLKRQLLDLIAVLEAGIDFAEDDIEIAPANEISGRIRALENGLIPIEASFAHGRIVRSGLTLAIVGRPNVGKSSLFNRLAERERAIVTATPGTTRDLVTETVSLGGIPLHLVDTAGLRDATDEAESLGIQKSREALAEADLVLVVVDASSKSTPEDAHLGLAIEGRRTLLVANKIDLLRSDAPPGTDARPTPAAFEDPPLRVSALTGEGISDLKARILSLMQMTSGEEQAGILTNVRQHQAITEAIASLNAAHQAAIAGIPHEMLLLDLYGALRALDSLSGETTTDDVLHLIFSTFCIGK